MSESKGLLGQIEDNKESTYSSLTYDSLKKVIDEVFFTKKEPIQAPSFIMYTGIIGYYIFQLTMAGVNTPQGYFTIDTFNRSRLIVLNLGIKFGLYKAVINLHNAEARVQIRQGTIVIKDAMSFDDLTVFLSKLPIDRKIFITRKLKSYNYK
jgi:hypothetical protein